MKSVPGLSYLLLETDDFSNKQRVMDPQTIPTDAAYHWVKPKFRARWSL